MRDEELHCKVECQDLVNRFAMFRDKPVKPGDFDALFVDDFLLVGPEGQQQGPELRAYFEEGKDFPFSIIHLFSNVLIDLTGPDTAVGTAYMTEYIIRNDEDEKLPRRIPSTPRLIGERAFQFRKIDAGWRISRYELIPVLSIDAQPSAQELVTARFYHNS